MEWSGPVARVSSPLHQNASKVSEARNVERDEVYWLEILRQLVYGRSFLGKRPRCFAAVYFSMAAGIVFQPLLSG